MPKPDSKYGSVEDLAKKIVSQYGDSDAELDNDGVNGRTFLSGNAVVTKTTIRSNLQGLERGTGWAGCSVTPNEAK